MIKIDNLKKVYDNGFEALKSINLEIEEGSLVCLLGPSGCGKTTMLNLIAGLLDPTAGEIYFAGKPVSSLHPKDRNIGMVFQNYALYPHMNVLDNVTFPLRVGKNKIPKEEANKIAREYLKLTDISELEEKKPSALSGGQQQRVAITRALVQKPQILLLDEPLSNLDARLRLKIREEIRTLVKKIGLTTIFVTHDQEEALSISDKIALMNQGVIMQYDLPQNLYLEPANLFVAQFIGNPIINTYDVSYENSTISFNNLKLKEADFVKERFKENLSDKDYTLGIRPEHFFLDENGPVEVQVQSVEMIGRYMIIHFDLQGQASRAVVDSRNKISIGQNIRFSIDYNSIYLFAKDGRRIY
ncbi:MAG: ABC transporter ATP-binding protein [Bacillota bacterium]|nr:ABC transporter ATP-binding protein [Bacillota bacterium]